MPFPWEWIPSLTSFFPKSSRVLTKANCEERREASLASAWQERKKTKTRQEDARKKNLRRTPLLIFSLWITEREKVGLGKQRERKNERRSMKKRKTSDYEIKEMRRREVKGKAEKRNQRRYCSSHSFSCPSIISYYTPYFFLFLYFILFPTPLLYSLFHRISLVFSSVVHFSKPLSPPLDLFLSSFLCSSLSFSFCGAVPLCVSL